jgi:predicted O-methyltransferase YrrM
VYAKKRLYTSSSPYYREIQDALKLSETRGLPSIEVSDLQGRFLVTQCQIIDAKNVLELGTLGGVSSIYLASSGPDVKVTTIEIDEQRKQVAEEAIANAGLSHRIEVLLGAGVDVLRRIKQDVDEGRRLKFDFVFIDADKPNNLNYYNAAVPMCRSRGCVMIDNVVRRGRLADDNAAREDPNVQGARDVIEVAGKDDRLMSTSMIQTVGEKNYDGFLICIVK